MECSWNMSGLTWMMHGLRMDYALIVICMDYERIMHGLYWNMDGSRKLAWIIHGLCIEYAWNLDGLCME